MFNKADALASRLISAIKSFNGALGSLSASTSSVSASIMTTRRKIERNASIASGDKRKSTASICGGLVEALNANGLSKPKSYFLCVYLGRDPRAVCGRGLSTTDPRSRYISTLHSALWQRTKHLLDGADFGRGIVTFTLAVEVLSFFDLPIRSLFFVLLTLQKLLRACRSLYGGVFLALAATLLVCLLLFIRVEVFMLALMFSRPLPLVLAFALCRALVFFRLVEGIDFSASSPSRSPNHPHLANIFRMYSCVEIIPFLWHAGHHPACSFRVTPT